MRGGMGPDPADPPSVPLLVAAGDADPVASDSRRLADAAPLGTFLELPDRDHFSAPTSRVFRQGAIDFLGRND
jgi:pimeloyl-ACP methyl ester carboxylesterase